MQRAAENRSGVGRDVWDGVPFCLREAIDEWVPPKSGRETDYQKSLADWLRSWFANARIWSPYGLADSQVDIGIEKQGLFSNTLILIEMKLNLSSKGEQQRLVGQIEEYSQHGEGLFVVLCGETDRRLLPPIEEKQRQLSSNGSWEERCNEFQVVVK